MIWLDSLHVTLAVLFLAWVGRDWAKGKPRALGTNSLIYQTIFNTILCLGFIFMGPRIWGGIPYFSSLGLNFLVEMVCVYWVIELMRQYEARVVLRIQ